MLLDRIFLIWVCVVRDFFRTEILFDFWKSLSRIISRKKVEGNPFVLFASSIIIADLFIIKDLYLLFHYIKILLLFIILLYYYYISIYFYFFFIIKDFSQSLPAPADRGKCFVLLFQYVRQKTVVRCLEYI